MACNWGDNVQGLLDQVRRRGNVMGVNRPRHHVKSPYCGTPHRPRAGDFCAACGRSLLCHWLWALIEIADLWLQVIGLAAFLLYLVLVATVVCFNVL